MGYAKLISVKNLPSDFHIELDNNFRKFLFARARGNRTWKALSKRLCYSRERLNCLKRGYRIIHSKKEKNLLSITLLKKISKLSNISMREIGKHILSVRDGRGKCYPLRLPIYESPKLASIIAHSLGDGHIRKSDFTYFNEREELIDDVKNNIKDVFGEIEPRIYFEDSGIRVTFPSLIAKLLCMFGSIKSNKTLQKFDIPKWIKNSDMTVKKEFVKALFDDEASLNLAQREIIFQMSNNKKFIISVLGILKEFGIKNKLIIFEKYKDKKNNEKFMYGFTIGKLENLIKYENIGFSHAEKQKILLNIIEKFQNIHYLYVNIREKIMSTLSERGSLSIRDLMKELNRSDDTIRTYLNILTKKNLIIKINSHPSKWTIR